MSFKHLKVGDEVFCSRLRNRGRGGDDEWTSKVTKIGRKWVEVTRGGANIDRFDIETGMADAKGYAPHFQAHKSESEYRAEIERQRAWQTLKDFFRNAYGQAPDHLTVEQMQSIEQTLKGPQ